MKMSSVSTSDRNDGITHTLVWALIHEIFRSNSERVALVPTKECDCPCSLFVHHEVNWSEQRISYVSECILLSKEIRNIVREL